MEFRYDIKRTAKFMGGGDHYRPWLKINVEVRFYANDVLIATDSDTLDKTITRDLAEDDLRKEINDLEKGLLENAKQVLSNLLMTERMLKELGYEVSVEGWHDP